MDVDCSDRIVREGIIAACGYQGNNRIQCPYGYMCVSFRKYSMCCKYIPPPIPPMNEMKCSNGQPKYNISCRSMKFWCPNTYICSKKEDTCCQDKMKKTDIEYMEHSGDLNCTDRILDKRGIPRKCRGGGSFRCPGGYNCTYPLNRRYTLCCRYIPPITCTKHGYIHPQKDGKWLDIDNCTVCKCVSQDNIKCKKNVKCSPSKHCKEDGPITLDIDGECNACSCVGGMLKKCKRCKLVCRCGKGNGKCKPCQQEVSVFSPCGEGRSCTTVQVRMNCTVRLSYKCRGLIWNDCPGDCAEPMEGWGEWSDFTNTCRKNGRGSKKRVRVCQKTCEVAQDVRIVKNKDGVKAEIHEEKCSPLA
ncbi:unnamed protein product [Owenia fusiformis]|uniref:Uncharacterized protein n=1 Tax=Owenia fusiformis TaxID=6347 RepID=A0A8J1TAG0_OWEFU|nr:unnamed protein product [Owenia fusiformis]